ncbi:MAG: radical SAM protein [Deltaproteobacteria bacterium]|nr:radical SAM protein [Deltaproteobacteria bacterium]
MTHSLILINPWIYDFAAYDLWSKPLGLLYIAGFLRQFGFRIHFIDCLDRHHPGMLEDNQFRAPKRRPYGTGKFWRMQIEKPDRLKHVQRPYSRYGISISIFERELSEIENPVAILVTSLMTYWYPGVREAIAIARKIHPGVPVILGGVYARLCHEHAMQTSGADRVVTEADPEVILKLFNDFGIEIPQSINDLQPRPYPAFDLLNKNDYICLLTSTGCPFRCRYCASHFLSPLLEQRDPHEILDEILYWNKYLGIRDFAFYDDALLVASEDHMAILLEAINRHDPDLRFHTPNALHAREISYDIAMLMRRTGFKTIRIGLETSDFSIHKDIDNKISEGDFERSVSNLQRAGFKASDIGVYILAGLPGQSVDSVLKTIDYIAGNGAVPYLSEYSPIPHTDLWEKAVEFSEYDITGEPLFQNNTLLPCWDSSRKREYQGLKDRALAVRRL